MTSAIRVESIRTMPLVASMCRKRFTGMSQIATLGTGILSVLSRIG